MWVTSTHANVSDYGMLYLTVALENAEFSWVEEKHNESGMRNPGGGGKRSQVDEIIFWQLLHKGHTKKLLCSNRSPFELGLFAKVTMSFSSTLENVEFLRDVFYLYPRKWDAQPRGGLDTRPVRCFFPLPSKTSSFYGMCFSSTLESGMRNPGGGLDTRPG